MVIVEGVDNTGKTTLIDNLCRDLPLLNRIPKTPGPAPEEVMWAFSKEYLGKPINQTRNMIFDRFHTLSELVYGPVIRGKIALSPDKVAWINDHLKLHRPLLIYCNRPIDRILSSFDEREQLEGVKDKIENLQLGYEGIIQSMSFDWFTRYDYEQDSYPELLAFVQDYLAQIMDVKKGRRR